MAMADKIADATFSGSTGKYAFEVYPLGTDFKNVGAVYIISRRSVDAQGKCTHTFIYIGQTGDLSERFDNHHKAKCFKNNKADCICVHFNSNEKSRLAVESDLIAGNSTPCND
jgi:predicted GIY-YIG superfamily endonuclease